MQLKSIYIKGFKSFYKETVLNFNERVTGIVGPNGSGKSNIVDAIRWVLGEQKPTELRVDQMSDVLFNGSSKHKKASMAQVTLTFDNTKNLLPTEYNTVEVSRILYRSGESEYRLNNVPCRLKDIRSLFMDTGIGPDSYAIIALNMVEDILADHNGYRRLMFEQASGISKFKKRKKETLSKLKLTKMDLDRIEDLLYEIEGNLKDLEKQARKAERYIKIRDQYKELAIRLQLLKYDEISSSLKKIKSDIQSALTKYRQLETKQKSVLAKMEEQKRIILESEKNLSGFQKKLNTHLDELRKNENEKQLLAQKLEFAKKKIEELQETRTELVEDIARLKEVIAGYRERLKAEQSKLEELLRKQKETNEEYLKIKEEYDKIKTFVDELNIKRKRAEEKKYQLLKDKAIAQNNIDNLLAEIKRKRESLNAILKELGDHKKVIEEKEKEKSFFQQKIKQLLDINRQREEKISDLQSEKEKLTQQRNKLSRILDARKNEMRLVQSMIENLEGFPESIKFLHKKWNDKIPLLTDIISTPDEYKVAIETYLEPYLNYFVVQNTALAREAITILRKSQKGKAHFFILDRLTDVKPPGKKHKSLIHALDIVQYDDKYKKLVIALLGDVYISPVEMDSIAAPDEDITVLDKSGSFLATKYTVAGGSLGLFEGKKIGRKQSLQQLKEEVKQYEKQLLEIDSKIIDIDKQIELLKVKENDSELTQLQKSYELANNALLKQKAYLENKTALAQRLQKEIEQNELKLKEYQSAIKEIEAEIEKTGDYLTQLNTSNPEKDSDMDALMQKLSAASQVANNAKIELIRQQNLIAAINKDLQYKTAELQSREERLKNIDRQIRSLQKEIEELQDKLLSLENKLVEQYRQKQEYEKDLSGIEKKYFENRNIIHTFEDELNKINQELNKTRFLINELKEKQLDLEFKQKAIDERLKIEFNLPLKDVLNYERGTENQYDLEEKVNRLRTRLDNYGEVNTLAVEAYNEMKARYDNIVAQRQDILDAEKSLKKTIVKIEKTATLKFLEAFAEIREHFKKVFTTLFTEGDSCDIYLEDEDNPLESKIKIIAKPKGKRPKSLNQLSGGEKTLTAIALLFSLYLYKPAPFCIFDEVDAPLDDANIYKFNNIIREFSKNSQFIVVTHNKTTMTAVDVLYGVFMQDPGVSEVAPVDLRTYEELNAENAAAG